MAIRISEALARKVSNRMRAELRKPLLDSIAKVTGVLAQQSRSSQDIVFDLVYAEFVEPWRPEGAIKLPPWVAGPVWGGTEIQLTFGYNNIQLQRPHGCRLPCPRHAIPVSEERFNAIKEMLAPVSRGAPHDLPEEAKLAWGGTADHHGPGYVMVRAIQHFSTVNQIYHHWPWFRQDFLSYFTETWSDDGPNERWRQHIGPFRAMPHLDKELLGRAEQGYAEYKASVDAALQYCETKLATATAIADSGAMPDFLK